MVTTVVASQSWAAGEYGPMAETVIPASLDSIDVILNHDPVDWMTDSALPIDERRTVRVIIEQSLDNGQTWQHWMDSGDIPTGQLPHSGVLTFGITVPEGRSRRAHVLFVVTGGSVIFGLDANVYRKNEV